MTAEKKELNKYIDKLLEIGIFKINDRQLYECSEKEVKQALLDVLSKKVEAKIRQSIH